MRIRKKGSLWLLGMLTALQAWAAEPATVKITNGDWSPFMGRNLPNSGFVSHIVTEAFAAEGVKVEYGFYPWARAYSTAQDEGWDASIAWYLTEERAQVFLFSDPIFIEQQVFFYAKESPLDWQTIADLKELPLGATIGYFYGEEFKKAEETGALKVSRVPNDEQNLHKLLAGRVKAAVLSQFVGLDLLKTKFSAKEREKIAVHPRAVNEGPLYLIAAKKKPQSPEWIAVFNRGLAQIKAKGQLEQILKTEQNR